MSENTEIQHKTRSTNSKADTKEVTKIFLTIWIAE